MGRMIDADKSKADLEKAISKNEDMDCLDFYALLLLLINSRPPTTRIRLWSSWKMRESFGRMHTTVIWGKRKQEVMSMQSKL